MAALLVFRDGTQVVGLNSRKTHPLQAKFGKNERAICRHAEIDALAKAARMGLTSELSSATMFVSRVKKDGSIGMAKPCVGCQRALEAFNVGDVVWTE